MEIFMKKLLLIITLISINIVFANNLNLKNTRQLAEYGYPLDQTVLGIAYLTGDGIKKDTRAAVYWISLAANQGYAEAQFILAHIYASGLNVPVDYNKARTLLEQSAIQGHIEAMETLSNIYLQGLYGIEQNPKEAKKWLEKAEKRRSM